MFFLLAPLDNNTHSVSQKSKNFVEAQMETIDLVFAMRATGYDGSSSDPDFTLEVMTLKPTRHNNSSTL